MRIGIFAAGLLLFTWALCAEGNANPLTSVVVSSGSIKVQGVEFRRGPRHGSGRYISLAAAKEALGNPADRYYGRGLLVYSWRGLGIHLQRGWRGPEKGKIFKLQVWLHDDYDPRAGKPTGSFPGHLRLDGLDITANNGFNGFRPELEKLGYHVNTVSGTTWAEKEGVKIFAVDGTDEIQRVEVWCEP